MGWFDDFKKKVQQQFVSKAGGEWAAMAMACMLFADGEAEQGEVEAAKRSCSSNPVIVQSIGAKRAEEIFGETVVAIETMPAAMLPSYEQKLAELAKSVTKVEDKNFALATVIGVAMGDGELEPAEHAMLVRFKDSLGATIDVPALKG